MLSVVCLNNGFMHSGQGLCFNFISLLFIVLCLFVGKISYLKLVVMSEIVAPRNERGMQMNAGGRLSCFLYNSCAGNVVLLYALFENSQEHASKVFIENYLNLVRRKRSIVKLHKQLAGQ